MPQSLKNDRSSKKICPKGHCFDDDELVYCPECGLPLSPFDSSHESPESYKEQEHSNQNNLNSQNQQYKTSDHSQPQNGSTINDNLSQATSSNKAIWFLAIIAAFALAFAVLELTDTTHFIPSLHQQTINGNNDQYISDYDSQHADPTLSQYNITVYSVNQAGEIFNSRTVPFYSEPLTIEADGYQTYFLTSEESIEVYPNQDGSPETYEVYFYYCTAEQLSIYQEPEPTQADYSWHLQFLGINKNKEDIESYANSIKVGDDVYFHASLTGGAPAESILLYYAFHMNNEEEWGSAFNDRSYDGSSVWVCCNTYKAGTLFVELYYYDNSNRRISLGTNSVYVEPDGKESAEEYPAYEYPTEEVHWFTFNIDVYDCDEYFYVGTLTVELPEGNVDLESYLPRRPVFNGEQYSFFSVTPQSVYIDRNGNMNTGDVVAHYAHNY